MKVIVLDDNDSACVRGLDQYKRRSSSSSSSSEITRDAEPLSAGSVTRLSVVLADGDDHDDVSESSEVLMVSHDEDRVMGMDRTSSRRRMKVIEHETTRTSTILIPNTAVDTSSSDKDNEKQLVADVADRGFTRCHSHFTVGQLSSSLLHAKKDCGVQTIDERYTQAVVEQSTQTDDQFRGGNVDDLRRTILQRDSQCSDKIDTLYLTGVPRDPVLQDTFNGDDSTLSKLMVDCPQQTTITSSTQTPIALQLGTEGRVIDDSDSLLLMHTRFDQTATVHRLLTGIVDCEETRNNELSALQWRDVGTQTFGQLEADLTPDLQTRTSTAHQQHMCCVNKSKVMQSCRNKHKEKDGEALPCSHQSRPHKRVVIEDSVELSLIHI